MVLNYSRCCPGEEVKSSGGKVGGREMSRLGGGELRPSLSEILRTTYFLLVAARSEPGQRKRRSAPSHRKAPLVRQTAPDGLGEARLMNI